MTVFATSYKFDRPALLAIFVIVFAIGSNLYAAGEANRIHLEICKAMNLRHYAKARNLLDRQLELREKRLAASSNSPPNDKVLELNTISDQSLIFELLEMGKYSQAKHVIETLPPVNGNQTNFRYQQQVCYRNEDMARALIGLHDYSGALELMTPNLMLSHDTSQLPLELTEAYLAAGVPEAALTNLEKGHTAQNDDFYKTYCPLTKIAKGDEEKAKRIAKKLIKFWLSAEKQGDTEAISALEFAADFMKLKGYPAESSELMEQVIRLKQQ